MEYRLNQDQIHTILTLFSTFLMGFIDAYTFVTYDGLFASAQTGNMVVLGAKLLDGNISEVLIHLTSFIGFAIGAFIAQGIVERYKNHDWKKYRVYLLLQTILLLVLAVSQQSIGVSLIAFLLGLLAGYELTVFRKIKTTSINNGIMTGNTKNLMNNLYLALFYKNRQALHTFLTLLLGVSVFLLGVLSGSVVLIWDELLILWAAFIMTGGFYIWLQIKKT